MAEPKAKVSGQKGAGPPRVFVRRHIIELHPNTIAAIDDLKQSIAPALLSKALTNFPYLDAAVMGIGFWFGFKLNKGIPGGLLLERFLGIPDFRDDVDKARQEVEGLQERIAALERNKKEIVSGSIGCEENCREMWRFHQKAGREFDMVKCMEDCERARGDTTSIDEEISRLGVEVAEKMKTLRRLRISQGLVVATWFVLLKHGILTGIGEIVPF